MFGKSPPLPGAARTSNSCFFRRSPKKKISFCWVIHPIEVRELITLHQSLARRDGAPLVLEPTDWIPAERVVAVGREVAQRPEHSEHAVCGGGSVDQLPSVRATLDGALDPGVAVFD